MGWTLFDLDDCPADYVPTIIEMINEEAENGNNRR